MLLLLGNLNRPPESSTLRVDINEDWLAVEMAASFSTINYIYNLRLFLEYQQDILEAYYDSPFFLDFPPFRRLKKLGHPLPHFNFLTWHQYLEDPKNLQIYVDSYLPNYKLRCTRIDFASPGSKDFLGVGAVIKELREFIQFFITRRENREKAELENTKLRIENARNMLKLRREYQETELEIAEIEILAKMLDTKSEPLAELAESNKITSTEILSN